MACIAMQVLYVFGLRRKPNPAVIDRAIGCVTDVPADPADVNFYLLEHGIKYAIYSTFDSHEFLKRGKQYLQEHRGKGWTEEHEAYFTPAKVAELQRLTRQDFVRERPYVKDGRLQSIKRRARKRDISRLLKQKRAVGFTVVTRDRHALITHVALLVPYPANKSYVWLYNPAPGGITVQSAHIKDVLPMIRWDLTVWAYWR